MPKGERLYISAMDLRGPKAKVAYDTFHKINNEEFHNQSKCFQALALEAGERRKKKHGKN